jgi:hypothetical protein
VPHAPGWIKRHGLSTSGLGHSLFVFGLTLHLFRKEVWL